MQRAAAVAVSGNNLVGDGAGEWCAVSMNQREVRAPFALSVVERPNPAAFVREQFGLRVQNQIVVPRTTSSRQFGSTLFADQDSTLYQFVNNLRTVKENDPCAWAIFLLLDGGFFEATEGDEIAGQWKVVLLLRVERADELVKVTAPDCIGGSFAFADGAPPFESMLGREIKLTARL
ncbi:MAG TPA: hypothetical protein VGA87_06785, partial [Pyrinomonadaceae bacterium]